MFGFKKVMLVKALVCALLLGQASAFGCDSDFEELDCREALSIHRLGSLRIADDVLDLLEEFEEEGWVTLVFTPEDKDEESVSVVVKTEALIKPMVLSNDEMPNLEGESLEVTQRPSIEEPKCKDFILKRLEEDNAKKGLKFKNVRLQKPLHSKKLNERK